ncbi:MAG: hypothetical protein HY819_03155 [Acidobacteria bacterium]|nr:hypothetical protein [Acidobacteriota bacterium]
MDSTEFTQIKCWQHLGDNSADVVTDAIFVGDQSTLMTFNINQTPLASERPLFFIELLRYGNSTPIVKLNGSSINAPMNNVGVSGAWEVWMIRDDTVNLNKGANTIQIFRQPGTDDFVVGNIVVFSKISNEAKSSGWKNIAANKWANIAGAGSSDYTAPQDLDRLAVNGWWGPQGSIYSEHSIIAMYVDDGKGARQLPFRRKVTGGGKSGVLEFRYVFATNPNFAQWYDPIVALVEGTWDRDGYIKNTYLPSLKWRAAAIPAL